MDGGATTPTERPVLFNGDMVRAILSGAKTVTRRPLDVPAGAEVGVYANMPAEVMLFGVGKQHPGTHTRSKLVKCPLGAAGDLLWVRETWRADDFDDAQTIYQADCPADAVAETRGIIRWRPSIHMPRVRSRLVLRVTEVRVERLHAIDAAGATREGIRRWSKDGALDKYAPADAEGDGPCWPWAECPRSAGGAFVRLWDSIYGGFETGWAANPWVWCVGFELVKGGA